ncbi:MAG: hypothetical protein M3271_10215 [Actinomycetota bacterium]|nr:hypothetical protein [Actinomycetota bacterium]
MKRRVAFSHSGGYSMVELLVSLLVFSLVTIGIVPLLALSMTSSTEAQSKTAGRNVVRQMMEHMRGIKYFVSYDAKPGKAVDLLDLYFPRIPPNGTLLAGQSYAATTNPPLVGTGGVFTNVCPAPSGTNPACPSDLPTGYTVTIAAAFVKPVAGTAPQTYAIETPPADYQFDSSAGGNKPPADLMDISVRADWTSATEAQSFELRSIIGPRQFRPVGAVESGPTPSPGSTSGTSASAARVGGSAVSEYLLQVNSGFSTNTMPTYANHGCLATPCKSEFILTTGISSSTIQSGDYVTADQETRFGTARVVRTYDGAPPASPPPDLKLIQGAVGIAHAPPDYAAPSSVEPPIGGATSIAINNPDIGTTNIAHLVRSSTTGVKAGTSSELPYAEGNWAGSTALTTQAYFHHIQADFAGMKLANDTSAPMVRSIWTSTTDPKIDGFSKVNTYSISDPATRRVEASVQQRNKLLQVLRLSFGGSRAVASIQDFQANVTCKATGNPATAVATATWTVGFFTYPSDPSNDDRIPSTLTGNTIALNGTAGTDPLQAVKASNPLVWDGRDENCVALTCDIFLFEERAADGTLTKRGYLSNWSTNKNLVTNVSPDGRSVSASIDGAIRIDTAPVTPTIPESTINVSLGQLSCHAEDNR